MTEIRAVPSPWCQFCQSAGTSVYRGLRDTLFDAPGEWDFRRCSNPMCGMLWLDPMPVEEDMKRAYEQYVTHTDRGQSPSSLARHFYNIVKDGYWALRYGYNKESAPRWKQLLGLLLFLDPSRRAYTDFYVMYLPARQSGRLLDVGCGSGILTESLRRMGWKAEGIDTDPEAVRNARSKGLKVFQGTVEEGHFPEQSFVAIIVSHVIEHVHEPFRLLRECHRILVPGGHLALVTPNAGSLGHRIFKDAWRNLEPPRHLHIFTLPALGRLAAQSGFRIARLATSIREADGIFAMSRSIQRTGTYTYRVRQRRAFWWWAKAMQLVEWGAMKVAPDLGEELVLVAVKP